MQFPHTPQHTQLPLFEAFMAQPLVPVLKEVIESPWSVEPEAFSELSLRGAAGNCLNLLAPILRELSQDQDARWLTLIAPPASVTQAWLRDAGLNRERILLLQPRGTQSAQQLTCEALRLGRSHTVVSWLNPLTTTARQQLISAARIGDAQSLNIRLG
ncbi:MULTISPECIES: SOS-induced cell division inhibitor SulA [Pseudomonas]|mgnify:FL=1|jgi:cell division inhibitor SulA|uniref:CDP-glycerol--UDP-pyrophosphoryl-N-acetylglucosaminyl-N-acetylmannosamine glycerophosphotransferase n=1 Tax=Pseudomonas bijieensis TaxID=2681983 RepID=A0A6N1CA39_9PSED|nr:MULTISPECIES: SOS-induced cell division inhibitor SulA [Pseudomonas]QIB04090.1 CDP-glycerol--UDP-pyrophosphoryl-N-acetylglucosaminyl-N-acetylmannosamine glycerophosphotransferase [Pseudomonas fluorescens]QKS82029.1 CDP-glycerol--UDP-pyrophosphoryl-N-acetylglucosaminyl-N-acetylmannosamine glycerophosphotransferase [Pseudomonas bijieensis]UQI32974.1 CDP-glycerol--UDP-pyrophosphoryl-N-acetylglucosaminyl-N-acetylmannosamine glycerophosphotransferase [Pseudomonas bijieensis]WLH64772.1 SulA-like l